MRYKASDYTYRVFWSEEDEAWVGVADEFKYMSHISEQDQLDAFTGIVKLISETVDEMYANGKEPPVPSSKQKALVPNAETLAAMRHAERAMYDDDPNDKAYSSVEELFADLDA